MPDYAIETPGIVRACVSAHDTAADLGDLLRDIGADSACAACSILLDFRASTITWDLGEARLLIDAHMGYLRHNPRLAILVAKAEQAAIIGMYKALAEPHGLPVRSYYDADDACRWLLSTPVHIDDTRKVYLHQQIDMRRKRRLAAAGEYDSRASESEAIRAAIDVYVRHVEERFGVKIP